MFNPVCFSTRWNLTPVVVVFSARGVAYLSFVYWFYLVWTILGILYICYYYSRSYGDMYKFSNNPLVFGVTLFNVIQSESYYILLISLWIVLFASPPKKNPLWGHRNDDHPFVWLFGIVITLTCTILALILLNLYNGFTSGQNKMHLGNINFLEIICECYHVYNFCQVFMKLIS